MQLFSVVLLSFFLAYPLNSQVKFIQNGRPPVDDHSFVLLTKSLTKTIIDLNGEWEYYLPGQDEGGNVRIPASYIGEETVEFKRTFRVDPVLIRESVFQFVALSIPYYCEVRVNGIFIGKHSGESSFSFKMSRGVIRSGENTISIKVNNVHNANETVPLHSRFRDRINYGGIVHDVAIVANGVVWVQESAVNTSFSAEGKPGTVTFNTLLNSGSVNKLAGDTSSAPVSFGKSRITHFVEIIDPATNLTVATSERSTVAIESDRLIHIESSVSIPSVKLWSPETPNTYIARLVSMYGSMLIDESYITFGFRNVEVRDGAFFLNGKKYFLKGITYVEHSPRHGRSVSPGEIERDILLIKNTGANAIRFTSGCIHPYYYSVCNKYGLLVFQDLFVSNVPSPVLAYPALQTSAVNTLKEMISRDINNPSLVGYGLAQGIDQKRNGYQTYISRLASSFKENDNHLLYATYSTLSLEAIPEELDFAGIDIVSGNTAAALNELEEIRSRTLNKPIFVASLSYPVEVGNFNGHSDPRSVDAQANFFLRLYSAVVESEYPGVFLSSFADWSVRIPLMTSDRVHQFTATFGIVDVYRQKRLAYDVIKARFNNEKPPVISSGDYKEEQPVIFVILGIIVIFVFALMYNVFSRFRENVVRSFLRPHNFYTDIRDQRILSIFQTSIVGLLGSLSFSLFFANLLYYWRTEMYVDQIISVVIQPVWLKQWLNYAAWNPFANIILTALAVFLMLFVYALLFRLLSVFFKRRVLLFDAYSISMWSVLPIIILAPFGMVAYRLLDIPAFEWIAVIAFLSFFVWTISRVLKGTCIVLDVRPGIYTTVGFVALAALFVAWIFSLDSSTEALHYFSYIFNSWTFVTTFM